MLNLMVQIYKFTLQNQQTLFVINFCEGSAQLPSVVHEILKTLLFGKSPWMCRKQFSKSTFTASSKNCLKLGVLDI